jgi:photosystem II stability/assembly factor-like uncharacterized protein
MENLKNTLLLGTRRGLIVYRRAQDGAWQFESEHHLGVPVSYAFADPRSGKWWACLDHGHWGCKLHWSADRGQTWAEVTAPQYPEGAEIDDDKPATLKYIWVMAAGPASQPGRLYAGTEPGGLFQSDDDGTTWQLVEGLWNHPTRKKGWFGGGRTYAAIHSILINPADPDHIHVGISVAGTFETRDGGKTWVPRNKGVRADFMPNPDIEVGQDPHLVTAHPGQFAVQWQQNHCGIFRTTDGAANWHDITQPNGPANFGFGIIADEKNLEEAWVVPATSDVMRVTIDRALCVCHTTDGGKTWEQQRSGLPQQQCYDLVYRHAMDITGDTLAFGSTTGNVFLSSNRGAHWTPLSNYLSDVYSLRFA